MLIVVSFVLGWLCSLICDALAYVMGQRSERALRIRRARTRNHAEVPAIK